MKKLIFASLFVFLLASGAWALGLSLSTGLKMGATSATDHENFNVTDNGGEAFVVTDGGGSNFKVRS